MPLSMANIGELHQIKKVGGRAEFREKLGVVAGGSITVVADSNGSLIVNVKDSRVAIGKDLANKIVV